jgi:hypothetical protein
MSITLTDSQGRSITVNAWNWGVLHYTVERSRPALFPDEQFLEGLRYGWVELSSVQADLLRRYVQDAVLPLLKPGQRMLFDLSITDEPDDGTFYRDHLEKNYSLQYETLVSVIEFLRDGVPPIAVR